MKSCTSYRSVVYLQQNLEKRLAVKLIHLNGDTFLIVQI